jgi:O-antigen ligase
LEKAIYLSILLLLVLTPIPYGAVEAWSTALWELWLFATIILWGVLVVKEGRLNFAWNPLLWPMLALLIVAFIQLLPLGEGERETISFNSYATFQAAIKLFASVFFFLLFATFVNTDERRNFTVKIIIGVCVLIALVGIGQSYIGKMIWQRGAFGPFVNRNHFAGFLEMGVGLVGGLIIGRSVRREMMAIYASCALAMCAGIVLSASRGGVLALVAGVAFLAIVAIPSFISSRSEIRQKRFGVAVRSVGAMVLSITAIIGSLFLVGSEGLVNNIAQSRGESENELLVSERYSRRDIWSATAHLIKDHPWLGVGLGAYPFAYTRYDQSSGSQRVEQAHNDYLQIVADAGLIGGLIALVFLILLFVRGFSAAQIRDRRRRSIILGALAGCFAIAIHSFVEFNLQITSNAQLFLALAVLATEKIDSGKN